MQAVTAFAGTINSYRYDVTHAGQPYEFQPGQRVTVEAGGASISSDTTAVTFSGNTIDIQWGQLVLPAGLYTPIIQVFEPNATEGQVLSGPGIPAEFQLTMRSTTPCSC